MMHEIDVPCEVETEEKSPLPEHHHHQQQQQHQQPPQDPDDPHDNPLISPSSAPSPPHQGVILIDVFGGSDDDDDGDHALEKTDEKHPKDGGGELQQSKGGGGAVDDPELTEESSELLLTAADRSPPSEEPPLEVVVAPGRSKWVKLRSTIKVACAFTPSVRKRQQLERQDSFLKRFSTRQAGSQYGEESCGGDGRRGQEGLTGENESKETETKRPMTFVINPDETFMFAWLTGLTCAVLYNLWTCIAREAFPEIHDGFEPLWFTADALCDLVYLLDVVVQLRTGYLEHGLIVFDSLKLTKHYVYSRDFVLDAVSLVPLDLVQIYIGVHPLIRFPRFLKAYRLYRFVYMVETRTAFPNMWRVANLSHVLFLGCHWFAAFYFLISKAEQFSTSWSYPPPNGEYASVTQKYLRSLYWSTLTLTTIGDLQSPESNWEFAFTITSYLIGVFVFATIVGQVGNVITNQNASRQEFERHLDGTKAYMRYHNVPRAMQQRVQRWYDYAWSRGRMNGGGDINSLGLLPDKLKTELALHVNLETLKKVAIFQKCEPEFLHDLVLKMKAFIFTPRDLICRKGEVAREMFIIADGLVEVVGDSGEVMKQMGAGDFFGEIGILNLDGGVNRRTADVRSLGYSELFVLSRDDVLSAFKDHPEAKELIMDYGEKRLKELGEHKRRVLCERLAKEISSSTAVVDGGGGGGTVGRMVLSTGLLHGIGLAASTAAAAAASASASGGGVQKHTKVLSNGGSVAGLGPSGDRWTSVLKMAIAKDKEDKDTDAESVDSSQMQSNNNNKGSGHERSLFRGLRSRAIGASSDTVSDDSKDHSGGTTEPSARSNPAVVVVGGQSLKQNDAIVPRRVAGFFASKKRGAPPRPAKLWSLGLAGRGQPVSRLVSSTETRHQKDKNGLKTEGEDLISPASPSSNNETSSTKAPNSTADSNNLILTDGGSGTVAMPRPRRRNLLEVLRSRHPPDRVDINSTDCVPLSSSSDDRSQQHESNESELTVAKSDRISQAKPEMRCDSHLDPPRPSTTSLQSNASLLSLASSAESTVTVDDDLQQQQHQQPAKDWPDSRTVSAKVTEKVHALIHSELVAMQSQYQSRLQQLEAEIVQKQSIIDRLRSELEAFNQRES